MNASNIASRITIDQAMFEDEAYLTTWFVDNLAVSRAEVVNNEPNKPIDYMVKDLQSGRSFLVTGTIQAQRIALQIAKAYLFDVIAEFGLDRLPEVAQAIQPSL